MPRKRLTDEERAERKRKAWDPNQFKKRSGAGNADQWKRAAAHLTSDDDSAAEYLAVLGLNELPKTLADLKKARRIAMQKVHPDLGGTEKEAQAVNQAYEHLKGDL